MLGTLMSDVIFIFRSPRRASNLDDDDAHTAQKIVEATAHEDSA
jgi:hypothetical protein